MDDLEDRLRAYRPVGPPPALRGRIVTPTRRRSLVLEWFPAAAALLLAVLFSWLTAIERQIVESRFTPVPPIEQAAMDLEVAQR